MKDFTDGTHPSICRLCLAFCPIEVEVRDGRVASVAGDRTGTPWNGYICPKGRALPEQHNAPERLLRPLKRTGEDTVQIGTEQAVTEVAKRVRRIVEAHGPEAVAFYIGTGVVSNPTGQGPGVAFMRALKSGMIFSAATIDKPAANVSMALHGSWVAGAHRMEDCEAWMVIGGNPVIAKSNGAPPNNPGMRLKERVADGMTLIVADPRVTETAKRATHHLQLKPGEDPALLAGMLHVIFEEGLADATFLEAHAQGAEELRSAVQPFTPDYAARRAGVDRDRLIAAARDFSNARIGGAICATGPSFATHANLTYYLALCLNTVCGHWPRAGQRAPFPNMLLPEYTPREQAYPPYPALGDKTLSASGLRLNASGMPTAGLSDQILTDGPDRVRALLCVGGNPVLAWPDQTRTERAMEALDLLVVFDFKETATAELADYVIPPPLTLEIPGHTQMVEWLKYIGVTRGMSVPWAQYTPAIVSPPEGSDLMDEGEFLFRVAQELGLQLDITFASGTGPHIEAPPRTVRLDMEAPPPSVADLLKMGSEGSRVPLDKVKLHPHGRLYDLDIPVSEAEPGNEARLQVGDSMMMEELASVLAIPAPEPGEDGRFWLICRRVNNFMNSVGQGLPGLGGLENPFSLHPDDLAALSLEPGQAVRVTSATGAAEGVAQPDASLRRGTISLTHGFGGRLGATARNTPGTSVAQLIGLDEADPVTGIPRMSGVPVTVERLS